MHGGASPQVKEAAARRLREGVMPMLAALYRLANDDSLPPAVQLAAVRDWLDRSGIKEHIVVEVQVQPWERLVNELLVDVDDADDFLRTRPVALPGDEPVVLEAEPAPALPTTKVPSRRNRPRVNLVR